MARGREAGTEPFKNRIRLDLAGSYWMSLEPAIRSRPRFETAFLVACGTFRNGDCLGATRSAPSVRSCTLTATPRGAEVARAKSDRAAKTKVCSSAISQVCSQMSSRHLISAGRMHAPSVATNRFTRTLFLHSACSLFGQYGDLSRDGRASPQKPDLSEPAPPAPAHPLDQQVQAGGNSKGRVADLILESLCRRLLVGDGVGLM